MSEQLFDLDEEERAILYAHRQRKQQEPQRHPLPQRRLQQCLPRPRPEGRQRVPPPARLHREHSRYSLHRG